MLLWNKPELANKHIKDLSFLEAWNLAVGLLVHEERKGTYSLTDNCAVDVWMG
jgi:hypothetical protein